jgi:hypothetical protein
MYKPSDSYAKVFCTSSPTTGAAQNADSTPTATANRNGTDDGTFALTVTNIDTGRYKITGTIPSGYAEGDVVCVSVAATVSSIAGKAVVDTFNVTTKAGYSLTQTFPANFASLAITVGGIVQSDVQTIKTQAVTCAAGVTVPSSIASPTNITAASGITLAAVTHTGAVIPTVSTVSNSVTVGTNNDKSGYSLTQTFPANFASLAITVGGIVQSDVQTIKTQAVTCAAGVTVPSSIASPTNITAASGITLAAVTHTGAVIPTVTTVSNSVTVGTNNDKSGYSLTVTPPTAVQNAVELLTHDWSTVTGEASHSALNALRFLRNPFTVVTTTGVLTVTKEDGSTTAWTGTFTTDSTALPISGFTTA